MKHLTRGSGLTAALLFIVLAALMLAVRGCAFPAAPAGEKQITISACSDTSQSIRSRDRVSCPLPGSFPFLMMQPHWIKPARL